MPDKLRNEKIKAVARELLKMRNLWLQGLRDAEKAGTLIDWMTHNVNLRFDCLPKEARHLLISQAEQLLTVGADNDAKGQK